MCVLLQISQQEKSVAEIKSQVLNLQTELTTKVDTIKTLELKLEEAGHTNSAKTQEMIRLEDELREVKSELNAVEAQCESAQQTVSNAHVCLHKNGINIFSKIVNISPLTYIRR